MLSIANTAQTELASDESTLSLAPEDLASLTQLMKQYDQVLLDIDALNDRLQEFLSHESPASGSLPNPTN